MTVSPYQTHELHGYDRLARLMGRDGEVSIFRRFGALSAERLLHRQADLQVLEAALRIQQEEDRNSDHPDRQRYHRNWRGVQRSAGEGVKEGNDSRQLEILNEIDEKLAQYQEALLRYQQIMNIRKPTKRHVSALVDWMDRPDRGNVVLIGKDRDIWREPDMDDLALMSSDDFLTSRVMPTIIYYYHQVLGRHIHKAETDSEDLRNTVLYNNDGVFAVIKMLATLLACALLMTSIALLYIIEDMKTRIGVTAAFTCFFALSINVTTDAKIKDIFGATAAFAAVLVVFIGTNDNVHA